MGNYGKIGICALCYFFFQLYLKLIVVFFVFHDYFLL